MTSSRFEESTTCEVDCVAIPARLFSRKGEGTLFCSKLFSRTKGVSRLFVSSSSSDGGIDESRKRISTQRRLYPALDRQVSPRTAHAEGQCAIKYQSFATKSFSSLFLRHPVVSLVSYASLPLVYTSQECRSTRTSRSKLKQRHFSSSKEARLSSIFSPATRSSSGSRWFSRQSR